MTTGKTIIRGALVAIAVTALGAGIAWAAESASKSVPTNSAWQAVIEIDPGVEGAFAKGGKPDNGPRLPVDDVDFPVSFDGDGNCRVNGEVVFSWSPGTIYRMMKPLSSNGRMVQHSDQSIQKSTR